MVSDQSCCESDRRFLRSIVTFLFMLIGMDLGSSVGHAGNPEESGATITFNKVKNVSIEESVSHLIAHYTFAVQNTKLVGESDIPTAACVDLLAFRRRTDKQAQDEILGEFGAQVIGGRISRIDIWHPDAKTAEGIHVGSPEEDVERAYGSALYRAKADFINANDPHGAALGRSTHFNAFVLKSVDGQREIVFETDTVEVVVIHVGEVGDFKIEDDGSVLVKPCLVITG